MRRFFALAALFVLSLSRFGAPAPAHARIWAVDRVTSELGAAVPGARLTAPVVRELAHRDAPRAPLPWLPVGVVPATGLHPAPVSRARVGVALERAPAEGWHRFTYDATAPPSLS
jgi:hypothetical protein